MIIIYKVTDYLGEVLTVKTTTLSVEEKKEEITNKVLTGKKGNNNTMLEKLINDYSKIGDCFLSVIELEKIDYVISEDMLEKRLQAYRKRCTHDNFKLKENLGFNPEVKGRKLRFYDSWVKHKRPSILTDVNNSIIQEISKELEISIEEIVDIIQLQSMFVIENTKKNISTKIPIVGTFRKTKKIRRRELNNKNNEGYDFNDYICN